MSDRDDIDVIDKTENESANADGKSNTAIRQNPPTEPAKKLTFLERIKRVFSTDDEFVFDDESEANREDNIDRHNDAHTSEKASALSSNKASEPSVQKNITAEANKPKMQSSTNDGKKQGSTDFAEINQEKNTETNKRTESVSAKTEDRHENTAAEDKKANTESPEDLAEEEEELLMINAFLDGEEYTPPEKNGSDEKTSEISVSDEAAEQKDSETDTADKEKEKTPADEYDSQDAFEDEDAVFVVDDEEEDIGTAEISNDEDKVELVGGEELNRPDKAEEKADENTGENSSEPSSAADESGEADTKNAENAAEKHGQDNLSEAADIEEKTDSDTGEDPKASAAPDNGNKEADSNSEAESDSGAAKIEGNSEKEEKDEKDEKNEKSENKTENSQNSEASADEPDSGSGDNKPEKKEENSEKGSVPTEELIEDEDDEEFIVDEDFLFDESEEDAIDDIKGSSDEFGEISEMLKSDEESSGEKAPDTKEYAAKELRAEPLDIKTEHIDAEKSEDKPEENSETAEKSEDKPEENSETAEKSEDKPEENSETAEKSEDKTEENSETAEKSEDKPEENSETAEKSEDKPEENSETAEKSEDKTEENSETAEKSEDKPEENSETAEKSENKPEENSDTAEKSEDKPEENSDTAEKSEDKTEEKKDEAPKEESGRIIDVTEVTPVDEDENSGQKKNGIGKIAGFFKDAKAKLAEIWKSTDDQNPADVISEEDLFAEIVDAESEFESPADDKTENSGSKEINTEQTEKTEQISEDKENSGEKLQENSEDSSEEKAEEKTEDSSEEKAEENTEDSSGEKTGEKSAPDDPNQQEDRTEDTSDKKNEQNDDTDETDEAEKAKTPVISIIKNDNVTETSFDADKLREKLNVIERDEKDVLTDEQKRRLENDRRVQQKVNEFERKAAQASAKNDGEAVPAPITELEISNYRPGSENQIRFTAGKFTESVKFEYECIVNYKKMISVSTKEALTEAPPEQPQQSLHTSRKAVLPDIRESDIPELKEAREFERSHDKVDSIGRRLDMQDDRSPEPIEYRSEEDAPEVRKYLSDKRKKTSLTFNIMLGLTCAAFIFSCFGGRFTVGAGTLALASAQRIFALVNFILYAGAVFCCRDIIIDGLQPLRNMKTNAYTGTAAAAVAAALQSLLSIISPVSFMGQSLTVYTLIVMLILLVTCAGRYFDADRISSNFRFVSDSAQKYAGKFFPDQRMVARLLSGTRNDKTELSFQKKTAFLKHFMRISNAEDPGDKLSASFALPTIILSVLIALAAGLISKSFFDAVSVLCVMLCAGVPISAEALAAVPLHRLAKKSLMNKSMIVGYTAVETFSESAAVMIDAKDLYPEGSIQLNDYRAFDRERWNDGLNAAAAVTAAAGGAMSGIFDSLIDKETRAASPNAEGVMFEDGKGLVGWVNNERVLIGNRRLLRSHGIYAPSTDEEAQFKSNGDEILYIALSSTLIGVLLIGYTANHRVSDVLKRMEASDMSLLVRTIDVNITAEKIAHDFGIGLKSIKILEQKNSNVIRDEMVGKERTSPAFIATKGGVTSFGLAVSECIQTKRCISLSLAIEIVGALLKMLIVTVIVLFAGIHNISSIAIFIISLFWIVGVLVSPLIVQRFQKN